MCGEQTAEPPGISRRAVLRGGAAAVGLAVLGRPSVVRSATPLGAALAGGAVVRAAMHVHASSSEGPASWEQQYANAAAAGVDVLWQTDHDFRARARDYLTRLTGGMLATGAGAARQRTATLAASGEVRLLVESSGSGRATAGLAMEDRPTAAHTFRTGIQGQTLTQVFGSGRLDAGARYELVVTLSLHPAQSGRPAGQYSVRYRFARGATRARFTEGGGLVGVVRAPWPAAGAVAVADLEADVRALWPTMLALDNSTFSLTLVVTSPRRGVVADVRLSSVTVGRARHDEESLRAAQEAIAARWSARYGVMGIPSEEVSLLPEDIAHLNVFGSPPEWSRKDGVDGSNWRTYYRAFVERVHDRGGVLSWNHPLGFATGPVLPPAEADAHRRSVLGSLLADDLLGADLLEVGYRLRGHVPFEQHLALWDTLSRRGRRLTGTGVSDDHSGRSWRSLSNGFLTGIWSASALETDLVAGLAAGRAYAWHPASCPELELDTLTDGTVPMGATSVGGAASRRVAIGATGLPAGCAVELVGGPVDGTGVDPGSAVVAVVPASAFAGSGVVEVAVDTTASCWVRPQVRRNGALVATGNPTWLLRP